MKKLRDLSLALLLTICTAGFAADDFNVAQLIASAKAAQKVVVYGGKGVRCRQNEVVKLIGKGNHLFLEKANELKASDAKTVLETFSKVEGFSALQDPKPKDKFNPDLCIEWTVDGKTTLVLVSFSGCAIEAIGPDFKLHCDFRGNPNGELRTTLSQFIPSSPLDDL